MPKKARPYTQSKGMGKRLEQVRKKAGLSQKDAGLKIGVSDTAVSSWERGVFEPPLSYIVYLTEEFCCDLSWLILGIETGSQAIAGSRIDIEREKKKLQTKEK